MPLKSLVLAELILLRFLQFILMTVKLILANLGNADAWNLMLLNVVKTRNYLPLSTPMVALSTNVSANLPPKLTVLLPRSKRLS